jgi:hypothetical protein
LTALCLLCARPCEPMTLRIREQTSCDLTTEVAFVGIRPRHIDVISSLFHTSIGVLIIGCALRSRRHGQKAMVCWPIGTGDHPFDMIPFPARFDAEPCPRVKREPCQRAKMEVWKPTQCLCHVEGPERPIPSGSPAKCHAIRSNLSYCGVLFTLIKLFGFLDVAECDY